MKLRDQNKKFREQNKKCLAGLEDGTLMKCRVNTLNGTLTEFAYKDGKLFISGRGKFKSLSAFAGSVYKRKFPNFKETKYEKGVNGWNHCEILKNGTWVKASKLRIT